MIEAGETIAHPELGELELPAVLHALSDPVRLQIVAALADGGEQSCGSLSLPVSKSTCAHHFRVLREAGVIRQRCRGHDAAELAAPRGARARFPGLLDAVTSSALTPSSDHR